MRPLAVQLGLLVCQSSAASTFHEALRVAPYSPSRALVSFEFTHEVTLRDAHSPAHYFPLEWLSLKGALAQCNPGPKPPPRMEIDLSHPLLPPGAGPRRASRPCDARV